MKKLIALSLIFSLALCAVAAPSLPDGVENTQNPNDKPLSAAEALKKITLPDGFTATLFASEPHVMQPIAFEFDDRGRLWVLENYSYPLWKFSNRDRIVILTDTDQDGQFDERKVFWDKGDRLMGMQLGHGGVWLSAAPNFLFIPDRDGDDVPDSEPKIVLDGFSLKAKHNSVNGLHWGPDGWLYGRHGITDTSKVGKPGTPDDERTQLNCSIWRYHPVREEFEVVTRGTTNPWGLDWDENGQAFFSNNVIGHLWHLVPGARYKRMHGEHFNPHLYELMQSCSDHLHWAGEKWQDSRSGKSHSELGGGHSHCGGMIYQGDNWPEAYRGQFFMCNIHGNRVIHDRIERKGSGYVGKHVKEPFLMANDPWFRGVTVNYGPDGGVFVSDWNDLGECHDRDGTLKSSGRIYKITYGQPNKLEAFDLKKKTDAELVALHEHKSEWFVRRARRILHERSVSGKIEKEAISNLRKMMTRGKTVPQRLRAIWTLYTIGKLNEKQLAKLTNHESEYVRWWAVQLLVDSAPEGEVQLNTDTMERFVEMAKNDPSSLGRLAVASALRRLPVADRWDIASALLSHAEDANDQNLPLITWYAIEPGVAKDKARAARLLASCKIQKVRQFISRRLVAP